MTTSVVELAPMSPRFHVTVVGPVPTTDAGAGVGAAAMPEHAVPAAITQRPSGATSVMTIDDVFDEYSPVSTCMVHVEIAPWLIVGTSTDFCTARSSALTV